MKPLLIEGNIFSDDRGKIFHVNDFDLSPIKRMYAIENINSAFYRGWKGHVVENRWFYCQIGAIEIQVIPIECFETKEPNIEKFNLTEENLNILFVPHGFATMIKQNRIKSRLLAMSDHVLGESNDENLRWESNFFKK
jgi:dTDP-4-dehydrorhamnose 3,5-epimerase-like enzyme